MKNRAAYKGPHPVDFFNTLKSLANEPENKPIKLRVKKVAAIANPYTDTVWIHRVLKQSMVKHCLDHNLFQDNPIHVESPIGKHAQRVAYLVKHGFTDPIEVDVGIEEMCAPTITDGMHRLAAALYKGDKTILANVAGQISLIKRYTKV